MTAVLLDTCAAIWLAEGLRFSRRAQDLVVEAAVEGSIFVSPVTGWEIGRLCVAGRFEHAKTYQAAKDWIVRFMSRGGVQPAPFTAVIALESIYLPELDHRDPADRFLLATARQMKIPLVTRDRVMLRYAEAGHVQCIAC